MQLSAHFNLDEFCTSQTATRVGIDMAPSPAITNALQSLVSNVLEPLRARINAPMHVSSGYRPPPLNKLLGGASNSQHVIGQAADIEVEGMTPFEVCESIIAAKLPFDQLIHEFGQWTHVSHNPTGAQRGEVLHAVRTNGGVHYLPGLP